MHDAAQRSAVLVARARFLLPSAYHLKLALHAIYHDLHVLEQTLQHLYTCVTSLFR